MNSLKELIGMKEVKTREQIISDIVSNSDETVLFAFGASITEKSDIKSVSLDKILYLDKSKISEEGNAILETLENESDFPYQDLYENLKWKIICLINIQDALPGTIYRHANENIFGTKNYFYYEGLHILREYFYCGFNNYLSAAEHLLRTFIEFNIKQCYFDYTCKEQNSFKPLTNYLNDTKCPSALKMANTFLPKSDIAKPIKKRIQLLLSSLSEKSSHSYRPIDSIRGNGKLRHEYSMDTVMFWLNLNHSITVVLWSYFFMRPILFNPKDIIRKFGFNYPLGAFVSNFQYMSIVNSISEKDLVIFKTFALEQQEFIDLEEFYNAKDDLTDKQIEETWDEEEDLESFDNGYLKKVIKIRAMIELVASRCSFDAQIDVDESLEPLIYKVSDYSWWQENYKKVKS